MKTRLTRIGALIVVAFVFAAPLPAQTSAAALDDTAKAKFERGDLDGALADLNRALSLDPNFAPAYSHRGMVRHERREFDDAIADYSRAIAIEAREATYYNNRGNSLIAKGDIAGAFADFDRSIALAPAHYIDAYLSRGNARKDLGNVAGAVEDFTVANLRKAKGDRPRRDR